VPANRRPRCRAESARAVAASAPPGCCLLGFRVSNCTIDHNQAIGGEGDDGGSGGNGLGGGIYNEGSTAFGVSSLTVTGSTITHNRASGGDADNSGTVGQGIGGGAYFASGGVVCLDMFTLLNISGNTGSTSNNDIFGVFTICP
jgi:hypothetical protein